MACRRIPKQAAMDLKPSDLTRTVSDMALISKAIDKPVSTYMTAGYLRLKPGYDRTLSTEYEEINLFLEGSLTYTFEEESFTAEPGDIVLIEQGSRVHYTTKEGCLVFYVLYPQLKTIREKPGES
ncbi:MAG: AraC family ligand binding domain-containing protein [Desulfobacterota bacterium]|nr:AraC family ligand binding domain-containing protein [Thermodesulfobacteriota bacterium]